MDLSRLNVGANPRTTLLAAVAGTAAVTVLVPFENTDLGRLGLAFLVSWVLCVLLLANGRGSGLYRPATAYVILFGLFHGGLLLCTMLRGPDLFTRYDHTWVHSAHTPQAVRLSILGMTALTLVASLTSGEARPARAETGTAARRALAVVGLGVQLAGLAIFVASVVRAGGFGAFFGGYHAYRDANEAGGLQGYGALFAGVGPVLAVAAGGRARLAAYSVFGIYALAVLAIGDRGAALFPLLALLVVEARLGRRPRWSWSVLGTVGVLVVIGIVRQTRHGSLSLASTLLSPLDAVAEMGRTLRVTVAALDWHAAGEPFRDGVTLLAVPLRFVERLTGWHGGPPVTDDRLFNVEVMARVGPFGGSPVAEGYHNLGAAGVVLLMAALGVVLGLLRRTPSTPMGAALVGVVLLPLLIQVRNSFAPVPVELAGGLLLLGAVHLVARRAGKEHDVEAGLDERPVLVYAVTVGQSARRNLRGQLGHLKACGYRVILMCTADEQTRAYADREGIELVPLDMKRGYLAVRDVRAFVRAVRVFRRTKPRLVCAATPKAGLVVGLAGLASRVPVRIYNLRGLRLEGERPGSWRYRLLCLVEYVTCRAAHIVLLPSESLRSRAISLGVVRPAKTRVLGRGSTNGVDLTRFRPVTAQARRAARLRWSLSPDAVVFGFVGRVVFDKGVDTLVDAFEALPRWVDADLLLVGGVEEEYMVPHGVLARMRDNPRIHQVGDVDETDRWYAAMDVLVLPSRREGLGNVLLEAAAAGLPCITTDATGCRDATQHEVTGLVVPVGDVACLTDAMTTLAGDPARREQMGAAGRRFVERHYDHTVVCSNTADLVGTLVRSR